MRSLGYWHPVESLPIFSSVYDSQARAKSEFGPVIYRQIIECPGNPSLISVKLRVSLHPKSSSLAVCARLAQVLHEKTLALLQYICKAVACVDVPSLP